MLENLPAGVLTIFRIHREGKHVSFFFKEEKSETGIQFIIRRQKNVFRNLVRPTYINFRTNFHSLRNVVTYFDKEFTTRKYCSGEFLLYRWLL